MSVNCEGCFKSSSLSKVRRKRYLFDSKLSVIHDNLESNLEYSVAAVDAMIVLLVMRKFVVCILPCVGWYNA